MRVMIFSPERLYGFTWIESFIERLDLSMTSSDLSPESLQELTSIC